MIREINYPNMRKTSYFCLLLGAVLLVASCTSSKELLEKGRYDDAIEKAAKKLRKNPDDSDELYVLREAFEQANAFDTQRIQFLEKEDHEGNWLEIYFLYTQLKDRQNVIRSLPGSVRDQFNLVNFDDEIIHAKKSAAESLYQQGLDYLERGDRQSARLAYQEFTKVKDIYPDYKDINRLLEESRYAGTNFVLLQVENNSDTILPKDFVAELKEISLVDLNSQWVQYESKADTSKYYDYFVVVNIQSIDVSPETVKEHTYTETKEIQDGRRYIYDDNGNVRKDSLGNDIQIPNMVTISADVKETVQYKEADVAGSIAYVNLQNDQLIHTDKLSVTAVFEHFSAVVSGDRRALSSESREKVGGRPVQFPSNELMLMDAADLLKDRAKAIIYQNRNLLANSGSAGY